MSMFFFKCLKCKTDNIFNGVPAILNNFICKKCKSKHIKIGNIHGLHLVHSTPIWQLEGTEIINLSSMPVSVRRINQKIEIEWLIKDKQKINEYQQIIEKKLNYKICF